MLKVFYKEEQKYKQPWLWLVIAAIPFGLIILFGYGYYQQVFLGEQFGNEPISDTGLILLGSFSALIGIGVSILFYLSALRVRVLKDYIELKYVPFMRKTKKIHKSEIKRFYARTYKPIKEYGGWGVKVSKPKNIAYNVYGKNGIQLILKSDIRILIGTQRPAVFEAALKKMMQNG